MTAADMLKMEATATAPEYYQLWTQLGSILQAARQGDRQLSTAIPEEFFSSVTEMLRERGFVVEECRYNNVSVTIRW